MRSSHRLRLEMIPKWQAAGKATPSDRRGDPFDHERRSMPGEGVFSERKGKAPKEYLEAIAGRLEAIASSLEAIASRFGGHC